MKKTFLFVFLFLFATIYANNKKKIIVALSLNDCVNCSVSLYEMNEILDNPKMTFVFKSELEPDSLLVYKKTGVNHFKQSNIVFSDSLFNKYVNGIKSTINIIENEKKIYSADLYKLNKNAFLEIYLDSKKKCFTNLKKGITKIQHDSSLLIYNPQFYRWSYIDEFNNFDIIADDEWTKKAYSVYYKDNSENEFKEYEALSKKYPAMLPTILKGIKINKNQILFLINVNFIDKQISANNINVYKRQFFVYYELKNQEISSIKYINTEHPSLQNKYQIVNSLSFHFINDEFIIPLNTYSDNPTVDSKYLSIFEINKKNTNELILKEIIKQTIPHNYIKYKIYNNLHSYCFDNSLVFLKYGEFIYDYKKDIKYKIPFNESTFEKLNNIVTNLANGDRKGAYYILNIKDLDNSILLLYKDSLNNLKVMKIDKKTQNAIYDKEILSSIELQAYTYIDSFSFDDEGKIQLLYNNNCIVNFTPKN